MKKYERPLTRVLEGNRKRILKSDKPEDQDVIIHSDILACRLCVQATFLTIIHLNQKKLGGRWYPLTTTQKFDDSGFVHSFAYSPELNIIVDPTYRQLLMHLPPEEFADLPRIFVGRPSDLRHLFEGKLPAHVYDSYVNATQDFDSPFHYFPRAPRLINGKAD